MNIMTKRGNLDNIVTYESICDTKEDLANIPAQYATLGSIALVIKGEDDMLEAYMATSEGEWVPIMMNGGSSGGGSGCDCVHLVLEEHLVDEPQTKSGGQRYVLNYTFDEITNALINGTVVFLSEETSKKGLLKVDNTPSNYMFSSITAGYNSEYKYFVTGLDTSHTNLMWSCESANDYPARSVGEV